MKLQRLIFAFGAMLTMLLGMQQPLSAKHHCSSESSDRCTAPKGQLFRGYGPNITPGGDIFIRCALFNDEGCPVGTISDSLTSDPNVFNHKFVLNDGGVLDMSATFESGVFSDFPIDTTTITAFPETAPYYGYPMSSAFIRVLAGNNSKGGPGVVSWHTKGSLKKVNYLEVRCVYLFLNNQVIQCLGCHYFMGRK